MSEPGLSLTVASGVATITFNRPETLNALDRTTKEQLLSALGQVAVDNAVRCVVLTGQGRAFSVGQDLREHVSNLRADDPAAAWSTVPEHYNRIALALHDLDKPVIAGVNGVAAGAGASLAFLADYRLLAASAGFNLAFAGIGLSCDTGCSWTLPRLVGPTRALAWLFQPRTITAAEALSSGIASEVVADEAFGDRLQELANDLAAGPTLAYAAIRRAVAFAAGHPLAEALAVEAELMARTGGSADHRAAVEAFLAKRPPMFKGR